ncbi:prepilin-type N-terminal cleavage/methylation domain-containing protein [Moritella sp. F3]|uniref:prepilin-type N-terminal cleavage/methylation domain-containing protein n=1 Tax=Moritella sp. F3 TaxID=2718882 RepID=UPI001A31BB43|nr:prepilin-type N-terminal cleavage/methylation domain-containing protein [Moritella sp. F3]GIC76090.1 MSHA biogenesis protein MshD [Moritella sp. F1]GIC82808.1 MSHA biogenesis protein MshD [Moritella sp. F3]
MSSMKKKQRGFTLIEIVVGIVVLVVALTIVTSTFLPQANKMTTPMYQIKATALGKSIMNQILIRYYDDANARTNGAIRCGKDIGGVTVACSSLGLDAGETSGNPGGFNDVDDYHVYCNTNPVDNLAAFTNEYPGYGLNICVTNAAAQFGETSTLDHVAKRIRMTIFMPNNEEITLTSFKGNY